jgi:hypothetical protein
VSVIYKHVLELKDEQLVEMPAPLQLLDVQYQNGSLCLWALVSENAPKERVPIRIIGTGQEWDDYTRITEKWEYLATVQQENMFVWHVFYRDPNR